MQAAVRFAAQQVEAYSGLLYPSHTEANGKWRRVGVVDWAAGYLPCELHDWTCTGWVTVCLLSTIEVVSEHWAASVTGYINIYRTASINDMFAVSVRCCYGCAMDDNHTYITQCMVSTLVHVRA